MLYFRGKVKNTCAAVCILFFKFGMIGAIKELLLKLSIMKFGTYLLIVLLMCSINAKAGSSDFAGNWKGNEQCQGVSAPLAIVVITTDGPSQVFLTGIYSIQGKIKGVVKGNTITIPRQVVNDPNFKNLMIEGSLTIGKNHLTLTGVFSVLNNESPDKCIVNYSK